MNRKNITLAVLFAATYVLELVAHYYRPDNFSWTRILLSLPVVFAAINYSRTVAVAIAMMLFVGQGPIMVFSYANTGVLTEDQIPAVLVVCSVAVWFGRIVRKEKEHMKSLEDISTLIKTVRGSNDENDILSSLENTFREKAMTREVATYLYDEEGILRRRGDAADALPEGHVFYRVAETGRMFASANPAVDGRIEYYGSAENSGFIRQLAALPLEYGGVKRGVIAIANSQDERFEKETAVYLDTIKKAVENTLGLWEKRRDRIAHEMKAGKIREELSSYLSSAVAEEMLKHPEKTELGGEARTVTVMFAGVTNFIELAGSEPPTELLARLNEYFSMAIDTIFEHDGTLDKFIGDNVMAFWGAPLETPDAERKAVACARRMQEKLKELNDRWEREGRKKFDVCVGLNTGPVVAGNVGSDRHMEYTVMGDTVNVAARIKSIAHNRGAAALVSESTRNAVSGHFEFTDAENVTVKGKRENIAVYGLKI